jgi:hypothetical protein
MQPETATEFIGLLKSYSPPWALALLAAAILCWRLPQIIRELRRKSKG